MCNSILYTVSSNVCFNPQKLQYINTLVSVKKYFIQLRTHWIDTYIFFFGYRLFQIWDAKYWEKLLLFKFSKRKKGEN